MDWWNRALVDRLIGGLVHWWIGGLVNHPSQMEGQNHDIKFRLDLGVWITKYTRSLRRRKNVTR